MTYTPLEKLSVKAAATIESRVLAITGGMLTPEGILAAEPEALRACGLSNAKVRYVRALAERVYAGTMDFDAIVAELDNEVVIKALVELPGIGRWTAEMFQIFGLRCLDVLSLGDVGLQRAIRQHFGEAGTLVALGPRWRPYRSIASWYLWQSLNAVPAASNPTESM